MIKHFFRMRPHQLRTFEEQAQQAFEDRALRHVREKLPEQSAGYSDEDARTLIRSCLPRSTSYGLTTERQIMCYLDATVLLGDQFETKPGGEWAMKVLRSDKVSRTDAAMLLLATSCSVYRSRHEGNDV